MPKYGMLGKPDIIKWIRNRKQMNHDTNNEVARLREELDRLKRGCQGSCYACEPVGEMNLKLEAEVARLREELKERIETQNTFALALLEKPEREVARLRAAAQAVVDRWETPLWKEAEPTAAVIYRLRDALATAPEENHTINKNINTAFNKNMNPYTAPEETQDVGTHAWRCPHCLAMWEGNYIPKGFQCPQCNRAK